MHTSTATVTVNAAFLLEIKEDNRTLRELLERCEQLARGPRSGHHWRRLLSELRDQIAMHFTLEEAFGYFDEPITAAPNLCDQAMQLIGEHVELYSEITSIAEMAEAICYDERPNVSWRTVANRFLRFQERLCEHERRENELIWHAYQMDIGVGD